MIGGLDSLDSGEITIADRNISGSDKKKLIDYRREDVGFVFQFYNLIPDLTVQENIEVVLDISKNPLDIEEVMTALDIEKYRNRFPKELSGGQQQRVLLARALCATSKVILLDEPVTGLDPKVTAEFYEILKKLNDKGITVIMVSHDLQSVSYATHILYLDSKDSFYGTKKEFMQSDKANVFGQMEGDEE